MYICSYPSDRFAREDGAVLERRKSKRGDGGKEKGESESGSVQALSLATDSWSRCKPLQMKRGGSAEIAIRYGTYKRSSLSFCPHPEQQYRSFRRHVACLKPDLNCRPRWDTLDFSSLRIFFPRT